MGAAAPKTSLSVALAVALAAAGLGIAGPATAATAPTSQSAGTFLGGMLGGTDLSTVAAIAGETAQSTGGRDVTRWNSLDVSALAGAVRLPLTNALQLPGGNVVTFGAVQQYAQAKADGSAHAASGAISNSGGIGVGGRTGTAPANATIDLAGAGGASLARTLGNLKLSIGALAAAADQARGSSGNQTGRYQIGSLAVDLSAPGLAALIGPLITQGTSTVSGLATAFDSLNLPVQVTGINDFPKLADELTSASADNGAITASLRTGAIHLDLAALLASNGVNLNALPPNTHLAPYLASALSTALPKAISDLIASEQAKFVAAFAKIGLSVGGVPLKGSALTQATAILDKLRETVTAALTAGAAQLAGSVFQPLALAFGQLLDPIVNVQFVSGGTFTERALQLRLGGGSAVLNLASAAVGPSMLGPAAPVTASASPSPAVRSQIKGVSTIKIDAGRASTGRGAGPWLPGIGLLLLVAGSAGLVQRRGRRG